MLWLQLCCLSPCPDRISPAAPTLEGRLVRGPAAPKLPDSLQHLGLVQTVAVQITEAWLSSCPCFAWASDRLGSDLPTVLCRLTGSHEVRAGWSLADLKTNLCRAGSVWLWGLADPTSASCVILENYVKRQYLKSTAFLMCKMELKTLFFFKTGSLSSCSERFTSILYDITFKFLPPPKSGQPNRPGVIPPDSASTPPPSHLCALNCHLLSSHLSLLKPQGQVSSLTEAWPGTQGCMNCMNCVLTGRNRVLTLQPELGILEGNCLLSYDVPHTSP